jgi:hypothetical protein
MIGRQGSMAVTGKTTLAEIAAKPKKSKAAATPAGEPDAAR